MSNVDNFAWLYEELDFDLVWNAVKRIETWYNQLPQIRRTRSPKR